ncbi:hypothetical protein CASFOL_015489 [Castilleja foliolosa]|uniref:Uncharacterized protein n=1 Tax=Castilleja foliolosa TaxID=1961234 RepID=A0ABD3DDV7_9LAMI
MSENFRSQPSMPSNELEDRVHNFFAQDISLQGQHHSQVVEGNWPVLNNNFWVGTQRQAEPLSSINKSYNSQNSDADRGGSGYPLHATQGLNFAQSNLGPDFAKSQSLPDQPNLNGFMNGNQVNQSRQNEGNFLGVESDSDRRQLVNSRGLSVCDLQGSVADYEAKASDRPMTSNSPVTFDLFGGQQPMSHNQSNVPQSFQHQQSMQHLQQQLMIKKMQELQWQQQLQQLDSGQHNFINQVPPFTKQSTVSQSTLVNGTLNSGTLQNPWTAEHGKNWLNRGSTSMKGSPSGSGFPPNLGQTQQFVDLGPQQVDQSLYGVPISGSMGLTGDQYNQMVTARSPMPQKSISSSFHQSNQHNLLTDQVDIQDESSMSRQNSQNKNMFGLPSRQSANDGIRNLGHMQQMNPISRNELHQDFLDRQQQVGRPEPSHEKPTRQVASPQNEVALDPTEKMILFGSDENIWSAFGNEPHMSGEAGNSLNGGWSALMQSAVAETSSSDIAPQEVWSGLGFHNNDAPSGNQPHPVNDSRKEASLADDNLRMSPALSSGSFPMSDAVNANNAMGQLGQRFQRGSGQRLQAEMSQKNFQASKEAGRWSNNSILQNSLAEGSQLYRDASQHTLQADRNTKVDSPSWASGQTGPALQSNGWNALAATPPGGDRVTNTHEAERSQHNSQNSQMRVMQGDTVLESSSWKSNSGPSSAIGLGHVNSRIGNSQASQGSLGLKGAGVSGETSPFLQNNYSLDQWKNAYSSVGAQEGESLGRLPRQANKLNQVFVSMNRREKEEVERHEVGNCDGKENSNDSHLSNLSEHTSGGFREGRLSDLGESPSLSTGNQMSTNQLPRKLSVPRKFQYHPMGNADQDAEPTYSLKQPTHVQAMSQHNAHFGQPNFFGHVSRNSMGLSSELERDAKGPDEEPSRGNFSGPVSNLHVPFSRPGDTHPAEKASSSSQNMLELFQKANQSRNHSAMMQFSPSECKDSPQPPEAETFVGAGVLQRSESSASQGFGLQLGPPSQRLQIPDPAFSSQNGQDTFNPLYSSNDAMQMGQKGQQMVPMHSVQSMSMPSIEETQAEFKLNRSETPGQGEKDNSLYKTSGNLTLAFSSGSPYSRSNSQNQPITRVSGDSFSGYASQSARRSMETQLPDASESFQQDNIASSRNISQHSGSNDIHERVPEATMTTRDGEWSSQHFAMPDISRQGYSAQVMHNMRTTVPTHKRNMGVQFQQVSSHVPESPQPRIVESSSIPFMEGDVNSQGSVDLNKDRVPKMKNLLGKVSAEKSRMNGSPTNSASTQNDIEAFGRSLKPSNVAHQDYSLLNQMDASKDADFDSSNRASKRMKGPENVADVHQAVLKAGQYNEHSAAVGNSLGSSAGVLSADPNMVGFSRPADILQRSTFQQGNIASQNTLGLSRDASQSYSRSDYMTSTRVDNPQVSPQMAPSWFNQYGTFKNGQMLPINDARKVIPLRPGEPHFTLNSEDKGTAAPTDACQTDESLQNLTPSFVATEHFPSQSPQPNVTSQHLAILRHEKRKTATSELHAWHKEISKGSQDPRTLSMAEVDWNKATNRLTEKVEDDAELTEGGSPVRRSKRRLILSTQLMQQLLRPAPAAILSADASNSYESVAYTVSRVALGDACITLSPSSNLDVPCDGTDIFLVKGESTESKGDRHYEKVTVQLMGKAKKLENELLRLDKSASMLDARVEFQDLEKFAVINRFARFHGRGHTENVENTSTDAAASSQKPNLQRYVTAVPMPESLPDSVQCLSL